jgi:hypothetical protein
MGIEWEIMMRPLTIALIFTFVAGGCTGRVHVVDLTGEPIQGASVAPVSLSLSGAAKLTDAHGDAEVPLNISSVAETKWVNVSQKGFESQQVDIPKKWPLRIVLQPTTQP